MHDRGLACLINSLSYLRSVLQEIHTGVVKGPHIEVQHLQPRTNRLPDSGVSVTLPAEHAQDQCVVKLYPKMSSEIVKKDQPFYVEDLATIRQTSLDTVRYGDMREGLGGMCMMTPPFCLLVHRCLLVPSLAGGMSRWLLLSFSFFCFFFFSFSRRRRITMQFARAHLWLEGCFVRPETVACHLPRMIEGQPGVKCCASVWLHSIHSIASCNSTCSGEWLHNPRSAPPTLIHGSGITKTQRPEATCAGRYVCVRMCACVRVSDCGGVFGTYVCLPRSRHIACGMVGWLTGSGSPCKLGDVTGPLNPKDKVLIRAYVQTPMAGSLVSYCRTHPLVRIE